MPTDGPRDLARFVEAQERTFDQAAAELRSGTKRGHWVWFVFPQIAGLGSSATARLYAIDSLAEAEAYLAHPVLGPRLREVTALVLTHRGRTLEAIFGAPDDRKFRSSMTLFAQASRGETGFLEALDLFCDGPDEATLRRLADG